MNEDPKKSWDEVTYKVLEWLPFVLIALAVLFLTPSLVKAVIATILLCAAAQIVIVRLGRGRPK